MYVSFVGLIPEGGQAPSVADYCQHYLIRKEVTGDLPI
jgi:hypothetical protein